GCVVECLAGGCVVESEQVPGDLSQTSDDPSLSDFETAHRALINVWIPSVFLRGRAANAYHVY
ncbi:hypothetical protein JZ751_006207, partial [Albula glossodonta]